jgi:hypothetical protein
MNYAWMDYRDGMKELKTDPIAAREIFEECETHLIKVLEHPDLSVGRRVTATSLELRVLIELDRHEEARSLTWEAIKDYDLNRAYEGDLVGLTLLRTANLETERAYAELLLAGRLAQTVQSRLHITWEQVHLLQKLGTPMAKAEAVRLCDQNPGKLDFDNLKKVLQ